MRVLDVDDMWYRLCEWIENGNGREQEENKGYPVAHPFTVNKAAAMQSTMKALTVQEAPSSSPQTAVDQQ